MSPATAGSDGRPLVRTVLLKGLDRRGFVFFTNLESRKSRQIGENPNVSILFPWLLRERQVVITGCATKIPLAESVKYFVSRPRGRQLAAWASRQSSIMIHGRLRVWLPMRSAGKEETATRRKGEAAKRATGLKNLTYGCIGSERRNRAMAPASKPKSRGFLNRLFGPFRRRIAPSPFRLLKRVL
jgi:Pyridoxamine-phosphate oxidase